MTNPGSENGMEHVLKCFLSTDSKEVLLRIPLSTCCHVTEWDTDDHAHCRNCGSKFRLINPRHHCWQCGRLMCSTCLPGTRLFIAPNGVQQSLRTCRPCTDRSLPSDVTWTPSYSTVFPHASADSLEVEPRENLTFCLVLTGAEKVIFQAGSFKERREWLVVLRTALDHQRSLSYGTLASAIIPHPCHLSSVHLQRGASCMTVVQQKEVWIADATEPRIRVFDGESRTPIAELTLSWSRLGVPTTCTPSTAPTISTAADSIVASGSGGGGGGSGGGGGGDNHASSEARESVLSPVSTIRYHAASNCLVVTISNRAVLVDVHTYRQRCWWVAHPRLITSALITTTPGSTKQHAPQTLLWCAGADGVIYVWDLDAIASGAGRVADMLEATTLHTKEPPSELQASPVVAPVAPEALLNREGGGPITSMLSVDDLCVWTGDCSGVMRIWNTGTLCLYRELVVRHHAEVTALMRQSGSIVWSAAKDNSIWMWHFYVTS